MKLYNITDATVCQDGFWKCKTGKTCIPVNRKCDSHFDCGDKSDEANCTQGMSLLLNDICTQSPI